MLTPFLYTDLIKWYFYNAINEAVCLSSFMARIQSMPSLPGPDKTIAMACFF